MLTRNGWWFAALGAACLVAGIALSYRELVILGLAFLGCLIVAAISVGLRPSLEVSREVSPHRVSEGDGASGVITISNLGRRRSASVEARRDARPLRRDPVVAVARSGKRAHRDLSAAHGAPRLLHGGTAPYQPERPAPPG